MRGKKGEVLSDDQKAQLASNLIRARGFESQDSLAARAGVSDRTIGLIEHCQIKFLPKATTLARLAVATGQNPHEWLAIAGRRISEDALDALRDAIKVHVLMEQLEPAAKIRKELKEYVEMRLASFAPSMELREEMRSYIDERMAQGPKETGFLRDLILRLIDLLKEGKGQS